MRTLLACCFGLVAAAAGVGGETGQDAADAVGAWLNCEECEDGELNAVLALGDTALPSLRQALLQGPSAAELEEARSHLMASYDGILPYWPAESGSPPPTRDEYVRMYLSNLVARYQKRAMIALETLGGRQAIQALEEALREELRDDVRREIVASLGRLHGTTNRRR